MSQINLDALLRVDDPDALTEARHLWRILIAALALVALSKVLAVQFDNAFDQVIADTLVDLVFEMGAALIGSVATVIFIEHRQKKQYIENVKYREAVQRRIQQLDARQPG